MKSYGPLYVGTLQYYHRKPLPVIEVGWTQETEHPYRKGKCVVFRAPFTKPGFYIGKWVYAPDIAEDDDHAIDSLLSNAISARTAWVPKDGKFDEIF
jgi:hypothetical protein